MRGWICFTMLATIFLWCSFSASARNWRAVSDTGSFLETQEKPKFNELKVKSSVGDSLHDWILQQFENDGDAGHDAALLFIRQNQIQQQIGGGLILQRMNDGITWIDAGIHIAAFLQFILASAASVRNQFAQEMRNIMMFVAIIVVAKHFDQIVN